MVISFKHGKRKAFWDFVDLNIVRIDKLFSIFEWYCFSQKEMKEQITRVLGECNLSPFNFRGWHEGTSTYIAVRENGEKFFVKKSRHKEAIEAEVDNLSYIEKNAKKELFETCKVVEKISMKHYAFVIETFLDGQVLSGELFIEEIGIQEKEGIVRKLHEIIQDFQRINFLHADFTPKNILIAKDGRIQIIDFEYSQIVNGNIKNTRLNTAKKRKLIHLGGDYSMENGIYDDAFSLTQIIRMHMPEFIERNHEEWREINLLVGKLQYEIKKKVK